jgi:hypothetical protein
MKEKEKEIDILLDNAAANLKRNAANVVKEGVSKITAYVIPLSLLYSLH